MHTTLGHGHGQKKRGGTPSLSRHEVREWACRGRMSLPGLLKTARGWQMGRWHDWARVRPDCARFNTATKGRARALPKRRRTQGWAQRRCDKLDAPSQADRRGRLVAWDPGGKSAREEIVETKGPVEDNENITAGIDTHNKTRKPREVRMGRVVSVSALMGAQVALSGSAVLTELLMLLLLPLLEVVVLVLLLSKHRTGGRRGASDIGGSGSSVAEDEGVR